MSKGIIHYTGGGLPEKVATAVRQQLLTIGLPIVSCTLEPLAFGQNIVINGKPGYFTMFRQILTALEASTAETIFFCEHDLLYHPSHFAFTPQENKFYYNHNFWRIGKGDIAVHWDANQVSGLVCFRKHAINFYRRRLQEIEATGFNRSYEPGGRDPNQSEAFKSELPNIDIRGSWNLTKSKWSLADFRDKSTAQNFESSTIAEIPGWDIMQLEELIQKA